MEPFASSFSASSNSSVPELPVLEGATTEFGFDKEQLIAYIAGIQGESNAGCFACFQSESSRSGESLKRAAKRAEKYYLGASLMGITYRRGQAPGSAPYLITIPLDRVGMVEVGQHPLNGRVLSSAIVTVSGVDCPAAAKINIVGLRNPEAFQQHVHELQKQLVNNLDSMGLPVVPDLQRAIALYNAMAQASKSPETAFGPRYSADLGEDALQDFMKHNYMAADMDGVGPSTPAPDMPRVFAAGFPGDAPTKSQSRGPVDLGSGQIGSMQRGTLKLTSLTDTQREDGSDMSSPVHGAVEPYLHTFSSPLQEKGGRSPSSGLSKSGKKPADLMQVNGVGLGDIFVNPLFVNGEGINPAE